MLLVKFKTWIIYVFLYVGIFHFSAIKAHVIYKSGQIKTTTTPSPGLVNCNKTILKAVAANIPPYAVNSENRTFGAIISMLELTVATCCGSSVSVQYGPWYRKLRQVEENLRTEDIALPIVRTSLMSVSGINGYVFLPVLRSSGAAVVVPEMSSEGNPISQSLLACWPLALLVVCSAGVAGIIVWVLDRYWNPDEFPKSFMRGCWEGTWWAYVTMTTVGYGDRAPKSIPARAFGLCWMFVGIIMMSVFTAALASAFTSTGSDTITNLRGLTTSVVEGSMEHILAITEGADVKAAATIQQMLNLVNNGTAEAALVDINYALYEYNKIEDLKLKIANTIPNEAVYGLVLYNQPTEVEQCLAQKMAQTQFKVSDMMINSVQKVKRKEVSQASQAVENVFSGLTTVIIVVASLWGAGFIACMMWEFLYYRPKLRKEQKDKGETSNTGCFGKKNKTTSQTELTKDEEVTSEIKDKDFLKQESLFANNKSGLVKHA